MPVSIKGHYRMAIGDLDGDGRDDIVFHGPEAATDSIWFATSTRGSFTPMSVDIDGTRAPVVGDFDGDGARSEEHTSELQSLMRISYAVFCLKKKKPKELNAHHIKYTS